MQLELLPSPERKNKHEHDYDPALSQWMTASWAAQAIVDYAFPRLPARAVVVEPSCGVGRFLEALPSHVRAIGVEIDPRLAEIARRETNREVMTGDFRNVDLPIARANAMIGNPPFELDVFEGMLERAYGLLGEGSQMAMILPAYAAQTTSRVLRWNRLWTLAHDMLPRTLFPGIRLPLILMRFIKEKRPRLHGFLLYEESREIEEMPGRYQQALRESRSAWRAAVEEALTTLGGEAALDEIYAEMAPRRPTRTQHWRPKVRQQLQRHFVRTGPARYALAA